MRRKEGDDRGKTSWENAERIKVRTKIGKEERGKAVIEEVEGGE